MRFVYFASSAGLFSSSNWIRSQDHIEEKNTEYFSVRSSEPLSLEYLFIFSYIITNKYRTLYARERIRIRGKVAQLSQQHDGIGDISVFSLEFFASICSSPQYERNGHER